MTGKLHAIVLGEPMSADEYLSLSLEEKAEDARLLGARAMERRGIVTAAEAGAYGLGIFEEPAE